MVLAGAYVDLHEAAAVAPEKISQVCQNRDAFSPFVGTTLSLRAPLLFVLGDGIKLPFKGASVSFRAGRRSPAE